jgi:hypothetical protein
MTNYQLLCGIIAKIVVIPFQRVRVQAGCPAGPRF